MDPRDDVLFGKIALNKRFITRELLNRALQYQRTHAPHRPLGEILLEKNVLSQQQIQEILAFQERVKNIKHTQSSFPGAGEVTDNSTVSWSHSPQQLVQPQAPEAGPQDALVGQVVGGCTILSKIGAGGMGAIYLARHEALRKDVVVKILPPESAANERTRERFFREARAAAKLDHPNIVAVQDVGTTDRGLHYILMQYIQGKNLEDKIQSEGRQSLEVANRIVLQVARGLEVAHAAGVIHRDIKAENILYTQDGVAKVTDFGLAKDLNSDLKLTADGAMIGTPLYMAPEIGRVKAIDGRVDIYSLGVTYYYLVTGNQPFRGFSAMDILSAKAHDKLKPPEELIPDLPVEYRNVIGKMLEKDRERRYPDVASLIRDLEALDRGFPVSATEPPSIWPVPGGARKGASGRTKRPDFGARGGRAAGGSGGAKASPGVVIGLVALGVVVVVLAIVLVFVLL